MKSGLFGTKHDMPWPHPLQVKYYFNTQSPSMELISTR